MDIMQGCSSRNTLTIIKIECFGLFGLKWVKFKDTEQQHKILAVQVKNILYVHLSAFNQYQ